MTRPTARWKLIIATALVFVAAACAEFGFLVSAASGQWASAFTYGVLFLVAAGCFLLGVIEPERRR